MIRSAARSKADYVKFQIYNSERLNKTWDNYVYKLLELRNHQLADCQISTILIECERNNIIPMFTIFALDRIEFLKCVFEGRKVALKIASPDMSNYKLIDSVIKEFPLCQLFISTGMHTLKEVINTIDLYKDDVFFLYCISHYPTLPEEINYGLMQTFDGFSDHTIGISCAKKAIDKGIGYVEKHYTLSRRLPGTDQAISIEPDELQMLTSHAYNLENETIYKRRWSDG